MLYDIYRIGMAAGDLDEEMDPLLMPDKPKNITHVVWIGMKIETEKAIYEGLEILEYSEDISKYSLLRKASSNGTNYGPSAQLTEVEKTLRKKIIPWLREASEDSMREEEQKALLDVYTELMEQQEEIILAINEKVPKTKGYMISIKLDGEVPFRVPMFYRYYESKIRKKILGEGGQMGTCCLCGKKNMPLVPKLDVFKFYTTDKPGFISGGFKEEDVWRNCPVCISCEPVLRSGKQYMLNQLHFKFVGIDYYLIPSSTCGELDLALLLEELKDITTKSFSLKEEAEKELHSLSGDAFEELSERQDINSYRILFFRKDNSAERILLDLKGIFPSRFQILYSAKHKMEHIYENITKEKFTFRYFRNYLAKSEPNSQVYDLNSNFLELTQAIFQKEKVETGSLIPFYMNYIRRAFLQDDYFFHTTIRAWIGIQYLQEIGCMERKEGGKKMDGKLENILEPYNAGLDSNIKKALVLTGVMVQKVMNIQAANLDGSTPFFKRLKGLKMRREDVFGLVKEAVNKMKEYERYSKESDIVATEIYELLLRVSDKEWKLSVDELNFYVAGGITLSGKIYEKLKEKE